MAELEVSSKQVGNITVIYPRGHINAHTVQDFEGHLQQVVDKGAAHIIVSGQELKYISSAGLGALMGVIEDVRSNQGDIRLSELSESVFNVFDILGFTHLFQVFPSEAEAVASFAD